jgi:hypothetical protein
LRNTIISSIKQGIRNTIGNILSSLRPVFHWPGTHTLAATTGTTPTFTRATSATFEDFEGVIRTAESSEPRFVGARRVENLVQNSQNIEGAGWGKSAGGAGSVPVLVSGNTYTLDPGGSTSSDWSGFTRTLSVLNGHSTVVRFEVSASREINLWVWGGDAATAVSQVTVGPTPQIISITHANVNSGAFYWRVYGNQTGVNGLPVDVTMTKVQAEITDGQTNQNPSEYVSTGVGTGAELVVTDTASWSRGLFSVDGTFVYSGDKFTATVGAGDTAVSPRWTIPISTVVGAEYVISGTLGGNAGSFSAATNSNGTGAFATLTGAGSKSLNFTAVGTTTYLVIGNNGSAGSTMEVTNASVKEASHGANIDGVQYFNTLNANTVTAGVVTEATGSALTSATTQFIELDGVSGTYVSTPDSAALPTGSHAYIAWVAPDDVTPAGNTSIVSQWLSTGNQRSFAFYTTTTSALRVILSEDGTATTDTIASDDTLPIADGEGLWVAYTYDETAQEIVFYTSQQPIGTAQSELSFAQLGTAQSTTVVSLHDSTANLTISGLNNATANNWVGKIARVVGIDSASLTATPAVDCDAGDYVSGSTFVSSTSGETWTLNGNASVFQPPVDASGPFGYLAEGASTNLALQSEDFTTSWVAQGSTISANAAVAPDGTTTMDRVVVGTTTAIHNVYQNISTTVDTNYTYSVYMKDDGAGFGGISLGHGTNFVAVVVDLSTGLVTDTEVGAGSGTIVATGCEDVGNGIYRVWISGRIGNAAGWMFLFASDAAVPATWLSGRPSYTGVLGEDILVWGAQVEQSTYPTSYIATAAAAVTRNADTLSSSLNEVYPLTAYAETVQSVDQSSGAAFSYIFAVNENTVWNQDEFYTRTIQSTAVYQAVAYSGSTLVANITGGTVAAGVLRTLTMAVALNDVEVYVDGVSIGSDTSAALPAAPTLMNIGMATNSGNQPYATVRNVKLFDERLTDAEVADL